jgi:hypothetical protein
VNPLFFVTINREIHAKIASKIFLVLESPAKRAYQAIAHFTTIVRQKETSNGDSFV